MMKTFDEWILTADIPPMRKFTCEKAMELAFNAGHEQGFREGFNEGRKVGEKEGLLKAADIAEPMYSSVFSHGNKTVSQVVAEEIRAAAMQFPTAPLGDMQVTYDIKMSKE